MNIEYRNRVNWLAVFVNNKFAGEISKTEDGFFRYFPDWSSDSYVPTWFLRGVADKIDKLNKDWQEEVDKFSGD
jgi:hypothetical protein